MAVGKFVMNPGPRKNTCFLISLQVYYFIILSLRVIYRVVTQHPPFSAVKENTGHVVYFIPRYSQPSMLNHLQQLLTLARSNNLEKQMTQIAYCGVLKVSPPLPPSFSSERLSTLRTCQEFGKQQAIRYGFAPEVMELVMCQS